MNLRTKLLMTATLLTTLAGCSSELPKPHLVEGGECVIHGEQAPIWACGGYMEADRYVGVGSAPLSKLGYDFSRKEAAINARADIAQQVEAQIKSKLDSYQRSTGADEMTAERVVTQVARQTSELTINNSQQVSYWQHPETEVIFILLGVEKATINNAIDSQIDQLDK